MTRGEYLDTPAGKLRRYEWRLRHRLHFEISNIKPRGKNSMPDADQLAFQKQVLEHLTVARRQAFRGPLALHLSLATTAKTPSHIHTIAKNLLDLLSRPRQALVTSRRGLLYLDDRQIHGLSVSCRHGESAPKIFITAMPMRFLLADLDLAIHAQTQLENEDDEDLDHDTEDIFDDLRNLLQRANSEREYLGDRTYNAVLNFRRFQAQQNLLKRSPISLANLGYLFGVSGVELSKKDTIWNDLYKTFESILRSTGFRILLAELPQRKDSSSVYKQQVEAKIRRFQKEYSWIIMPLVIPVALEVIIKQPPPFRTRGVHDLDNILRNFIIPRIVDVLKPPSSIGWTIDVEALKDSNPESYNYWRCIMERIPRSTRIVVTRYEVWKLPRPHNDTSAGFVSVAVAADWSPPHDVFDRIDDIIRRWNRLR
jgi:hypothetical protein